MEMKHGVTLFEFENQRIQSAVINAGMKHPQGVIASASAGISPEANVTWLLEGNKVRLWCHYPSAVSGTCLVSWCVFGSNVS